MPEVSSDTVISEYGDTAFAAAYITSNKDKTFQLGILDTSNEQVGHLARAIQSISVSFSMDLTPQISVQLFDVNMAMLENNYFNIGRTFIYKTSQRMELPRATEVSSGPSTDGQDDVAPVAPNLGESELGFAIMPLELASLSVGPGSGSSPSITLELRSKAILQMKRDRKPGSINGSGHVFVQQAAIKYNLGYYTEVTNKDKKINKASSDRRADSLWDVLSSLASEAKFSLFEVDGIIVFSSMRNLFGKWGPEQITGNVVDETTNLPVQRTMNSWYVEWPYLRQATIGQADVIDVGGVRNNLSFARTLIPLQCPTFRRSDSDVYQVEGSLSLDRHNSMILRPGMTIYVAGVPTFEDFYIITQVSFDHMSTNPVQVSFTKPEREDKFVVDVPIDFIAASNDTVWE